MSAFFQETVLSVHHWNDTLFSFTTTRNPTLRFKTGQFVMIGLEVNGKPLMRAYSVVSAHYEDHLEFYSIKVPDGPLTSKLQHLQVGDTLLVSKKPTGSLIIDNLKRTQAERTNGRLKDDFGGRHIRVKGHARILTS